MNSTESTMAGPGYTLWQMVLYMLRLGSLGFGGPVALVGYMHRDLVEQRGWISEAQAPQAQHVQHHLPQGVAGAGRR